MKHGSILLVVLLGLVPLSPVRAQTPAGALQSLAIGIWPDYDRPSVLVLLTGTLGADAPLPAQVTLPLPAGAHLHAVARIDGEGRMIDDIGYGVKTPSLTLTTPDPRFRVEYYLPYRVEGHEHIFEFAWLADLSVERLGVSVQRPAAAEALLTQPEPANVSEGQDGLTYHVLPTRAVPAGTPYAVGVRYPMTTPRLSAAGSGAPATAAQAIGAGASASPPAAGFDWAYLLIGIVAVLAGAVFAWGIARALAARQIRAPASRERGAPARFCHACGERVHGDDRFCRHCGAAVRGR